MQRDGTPQQAAEHSVYCRRHSGRFGLRSAIVVVSAALALVVAEPSRAAISLVFGSYAEDKPSAMVEQLRPTLDVVEKTLTKMLGERVEIRLQVMRGYDEGVDLIVSGGADVMRLGPASYVVAKARNPGIEILAVENNRGAKTFDGVICVRSDSSITDLQQLKGKSFAFGNEESTLGRYFAQLYLARAGLHARDLLRYEYLGRHDRVGAAVGSGLFDAGALEETTFGALVRSGVPIRAITRFPNATRPWVARARLDERLERALRQALLQVKEPEALAALRFEGFLEGDDSDYELTRQAIEQNARFFAVSQ